MTMDHLSPELQDAKTDLEIALKGNVRAIWPEGEAYLEAKQPREIAEALIDHLCPELQRARIAYLFREELAPKGEKVHLAHAAKASAKLAYLAEIDFVIEVNWSAYRTLTPAQRVALMDHELSHCSRDAERDKWVLLAHDVEEFSGVVRRHGLWKPDLQQFKAQLDLFGRREAA